jgi:hypothetical protein
MRRENGRKNTLSRKDATAMSNREVSTFFGGNLAIAE